MVSKTTFGVLLASKFLLLNVVKADNSMFNPGLCEKQTGMSSKGVLQSWQSGIMLSSGGP
jgi:hypothetical protein